MWNMPHQEIPTRNLHETIGHGCCGSHMTRANDQQRVVLLVSLITSLAVLSPLAAADDTAKRDAPHPEAATLAATVPDAGKTPDPASGASTTTTAAPDQAEAPRYPRAVIARPLTLPQ